MIITDLYQTKIECKQGITETDYYNVNIDANDMLVIVTLLDFNGNAVKNKDVTLTVDKGYFTQKGNKTGSNTANLTSVNNSKTITVNTGSYGNIIGLYTASEWGLCTFSANNTKIQCKVTGWKLIKSTTGNIKLYNNGTYGAVVCDGINFTCNANSTKTFSSDNFEDVDSKYLPVGAVTFALNYHTCGFIVRYDGQLTAYNISGTDRSSVKMYGNTLFKTQ